MNNKFNLNTYLMYNFVKNCTSETNENVTSTLYVQRLYNSRFNPPAPASPIVQCLYNFSLLKSTRGRQTYIICTFKGFSSRAKESEMYIYCTVEVFWLASLAYIFSSTAFSKVQRTTTVFSIVQSAMRVYKSFASNCTQSTTAENQHFRIVQQIQLFAQV